MSSTDEFNWRALFSTLRIKFNVMPPYRKYSTPERLELKHQLKHQTGHRLNHRATKAALCTRVCCTASNRVARFVIISRRIEEYTNSVCNQGGKRVAQRVAPVHQAQPRGQCVRLTTHNIYTDYNN